jgi:alpha-D-ribose 1-methylphosphonate 5-triphosphate diphosphatase
MSNEFVLSNALVVCPSEVFHGCVLVRDSVIAAVSRDAFHGPAIDCAGDYLLPGAVDIHTDNLEKHMLPRPGVLWPVMPAVLAHDMQVAAAGVTTVLDSLCLGLEGEGVRRFDVVKQTIDALDAGQAKHMFRTEHLLHLRTEVSGPTALSEFSWVADHPSLRLVSVMDHTPGQRQWPDLEKYKAMERKHSKMLDEEIEALLKVQLEQQAEFAEPNRRVIINECKQRGLPLASHDDATLEHIAQAQAEQLEIAEFPTTLAAARAARQAGMAVVAGSPNLVLGGSHSGNVSVEELARQGLLSVLSSDYVPASLIHGVFLLHTRLNVPLHEAVAMISGNAAAIVGLHDRGAIEQGKRADLVRVRQFETLPHVIEVWRAGARVA